MSVPFGLAAKKRTHV